MRHDERKGRRPLSPAHVQSEYGIPQLPSEIAAAGSISPLRVASHSYAANTQPGSACMRDWSRTPSPHFQAHPASVWCRCDALNLQVLHPKFESQIVPQPFSHCPSKKEPLAKRRSHGRTRPESPMRLANLRAYRVESRPRRGDAPKPVMVHNMGMISQNCLPDLITSLSARI